MLSKAAIKFIKILNEFIKVSVSVFERDRKRDRERQRERHRESSRVKLVT